MKVNVCVKKRGASTEKRHDALTQASETERDSGNPVHGNYF